MRTKTMVFKCKAPVKICALLLILAIAALPIPSAVAGAGGKYAASGDEEGAQAISVPMAKVTIQRKVLEAVITNVGDRYKVSKETIITNPDGQQVSIREFLVPCDVEITYHTENGERVAQRIKTTRISKNSTWKWGADAPE